MIDTRNWRHVFKLDPDKFIAGADLEMICESGTDAILIGGTQNITFDKTIDLLGRVRRYATPCVLEMSNVKAVVPGFDHYLVPFVINAAHPQWLIKPHFEGVKAYGTMIPWQDVSMVAYCVLNPKSAVAKLTDSQTDLQAEDVLTYARMAAHMFHMPYFYLEYSGTYGDPALVQQVQQTIHTEAAGMQLFYGGGITGGIQSREMQQVADTVVVGNIIYEDIQAALATVR